jgi:hypothetical protein
MKIAGRLAAVVGALALGSGLAVVTAPAQAATTPTVSVTVTDYSNPTHPRYGDYVSVNAEVRNAAGESVYAGSVQLQMAPVGSTAWTNVGDGTSTYAYYSIDSLTSPVQFQAVYSGGTGGYPAVTYSPATSAAVAITSIDRGTAVAKQTKKKICYQVGPAPYKNKPIKYYAKIGKSKKWRAVGSVRTNKKSQYCYKITHTKVKTPVKYKGPKLKAFKTVYVKTGGMKKSVQISTY